ELNLVAAKRSARHGSPFGGDYLKLVGTHLDVRGNWLLSYLDAVHTRTARSQRASELHDTFVQVGDMVNLVEVPDVHEGLRFHLRDPCHNSPPSLRNPRRVSENPLQFMVHHTVKGCRQPVTGISPALQIGLNRQSTRWYSIVVCHDVSPFVQSA